MTSHPILCLLQLALCGGILHIDLAIVDNGLGFGAFLQFVYAIYGKTTLCMLWMYTFSDE